MPECFYRASTQAYTLKTWISAPRLRGGMLFAEMAIGVNQYLNDYSDPIAHMHFTPPAHTHATASLCNIADEFCQGCIIALGGGDYNRGNLAAGWSAVLTQLCG